MCELVQTSFYKFQIIDYFLKELKFGRCGNETDLDDTIIKKLISLGVEFDEFWLIAKIYVDKEFDKEDDPDWDNSTIESDLKAKIRKKWKTLG